MNFRSTPVLAHSSKVTARGSLPLGGFGLMPKEAENGWVGRVVVVVVVVVVGAWVVTGGWVTALVVDVVSLLLLLLMATAAPATAAPPATMPRTAPLDSPPAAAPTKPEKPGMSAGAPGVAPTTTVARVRNGATGTSLRH